MSTTYTVQYDPRTGQPANIERSDGTTTAIGSGNAVWLDFLTWNAQQPTPLDYTTPYLPLATVQAQRIAAFVAAGAAAVAACYDSNTSVLLSANYAQALAHGLSNRAAYLQPIVDWGNAIAAAIEAASEQVLAATTAAQVAAVTLTLPSAPSPLPTRAGAMAIAN